MLFTVSRVSKQTARALIYRPHSRQNILHCHSNFTRCVQRLKRSQMREKSVKKLPDNVPRTGC